MYRVRSVFFYDETYLNESVKTVKIKNTVDSYQLITSSVRAAGRNVFFQIILAEKQTHLTFFYDQARPQRKRKNVNDVTKTFHDSVFRIP